MEDDCFLLANLVGDDLYNISRKDTQKLLAICDGEGKCVREIAITTIKILFEL